MIAFLPIKGKPKDIPPPQKKDSNIKKKKTSQVANANSPVFPECHDVVALRVTVSRSIAFVLKSALYYYYHVIITVTPRTI